MTSYAAVVPLPEGLEAMPDGFDDDKQQVKGDGKGKEKWDEPGL